jgi:hypothetical protein
VKSTKTVVRRRVPIPLALRPLLLALKAEAGGPRVGVPTSPAPNLFEEHDNGPG